MILLADCHVSRDEMETLKRHDIPHRLDLSHPHFMWVTQQLCDDLRTYAEIPWQGAKGLPASSWHAMLDEIDETGQLSPIVNRASAVALSGRPQP